MVDHYDAIKFYSKKQKHYPITDMFMWIKYIKMNKKFEDEYIVLADEMLNKNFSNKNQDCKYCVSYYESFKRLNEVPIFKDITTAEEMLFLHPNVCKEIYEPNQKWHFLFAWYGIKYAITKGVEELKKLRIQTKIGKLDFNSEFNMNHVKCRELYLWMYEAALDNEIIKKEDLYELFYEAIRYEFDGIGFFNELVSTKVIPKIKECIEKSKKVDI